MVVAWLRRMGQKLCKPDIPDKFLTPGSVPLEAAEVKRIRKLVIKKKLAPFYPGSDDTGESREHVECPICFLQYLCMNRSLCCGQKICSECFIKIRANSGGSYLGCSCPFCKSPGYTVELCGAKSEDEKKEELLEEQRMVEHRLRQQQEEVGAAMPDAAQISTNAQIVAAEIDAEDSFGASQVSALGEENIAQNGNSPSEASSFMQPLSPLPIVHNRGASSTGDGTPSAVIQEEYQQEYSVLSSRNSGAPLSNTEMTQCAEYLGVFPEDLGVRVAEFNELLLQQAIITSMLESRSAQQNSTEATQDPQSGRRPDTPRPGSDGLLDGGGGRLSWGNMGPSQVRVNSSSDDGWDEIGGERRPDTPRPPYSSVPDDQLAESVSRWANDAVDPNWDFVNLLIGGGGSSRPVPDEEETSNGQAQPWGSAGPVGEGDAREGMAADRPIRGKELFNSIRRLGSCPARLDGLVKADSRSTIPLGGPSGTHGGSTSASPEQTSVVSRIQSMPHGRSPEYTSMWRRFVAGLALSGELDAKSTTVHVGMVFEVQNNPPPDMDKKVYREHDAGRYVEPQSLQVCERVRTDRQPDPEGIETIAVNNPDGSLMLVSAQKAGDRSDEGGSGAGENPADDALRAELLASDARIKESIERGDQVGCEADNSASGSGNEGNVNCGDRSVTDAISRADDDWVRRMQKMDEELKKALGQ